MYYIGIDGGGTKTKYVLCNDKGVVIAGISKPSANYIQIGYENLTKAYEDGIETLLEKVNVKKEEIANAFVGCSGYGDVLKDENIINEHVKKAFGNIKYQIANDGVNAMAGALAGKDGINIVAGTGSIAFGYNSKTKQTLKCGGWHQLIGSDEGSGYWQAIQLLIAFERQADGRDAKTKLYEQVRENLGIDDDGEVITRVVEEWKMDRTKVASLSKIVNELYDINDPNAIDIVNRSAHELADIVQTLYKKLNFKEKITISYTGGVWNMRDKILKPFIKKLAGIDAEILPPVLNPDAGALILAMQNDGIKINEEIINNLKQTCK